VCQEEEAAPERADGEWGEGVTNDRLQVCVDAFSVGGFSFSLGQRVTHDTLQESVDAFMQLPSVLVRLRGRVRPVYALKTSNTLQTRLCVQVSTHTHTCDAKTHGKIKSALWSGIHTHTHTHTHEIQTMERSKV
jgi:hypothetical protein